MKTIISVLFLVFSLGCAHRITVKNPTFKVGDNLGLTSNFLKNKKEKFDFSFNLNNLGNQIVTLNWEDFICGKGEAEGIIPRNKFLAYIQGNWGGGYTVTEGETVHTSQGKPHIPGKGSRRLILTCEIQTKLPGDFFIGINKNFSNPNAKPEFVKWYLITK